MNQNDNQNINGNFQGNNSNNQPLGYIDPSMYTMNTFQNQTTNNIENQASETKKTKKKWPILVAIVLIIVVALGGSLYYDSKHKGNDNENTISDKKILVAYYSREGENYGFNLAEKVNIEKGNTEVMAEKIADYLNADLYRIVPSVPYPDDLDELYIQSKKELNSDYYPEILNSIDISKYDIVFIGYPIWHQNYPQIIKTFVRDHESDLKNKTIVPFNTHAGAGDAGTYKKLKTLIGVDSSKFLDGMNLNGTKVSTSDEKIKEWLTGLGFEIK